MEVENKIWTISRSVNHLVCSRSSIERENEKRGFVFVLEKMSGCFENKRIEDCSKRIFFGFLL